MRPDIIAIDPGNEESAWCAVEKERPLASGKVANSELLGLLHEWPASHLLAVEMIASYGMPVGREVFDTCLWIGRFIQVWNARGGKYVLVYRREVKIFHCNSARATDANIRASLIDRFGPGKGKAIGTKKEPGPLYGMKGDTWSALAVAIKAAQLPHPAAPELLP
jgi:hypothetical protein